MANNIRDLAAVLTDSRYWGLRADNCSAKLDLKGPPDVIRALRQAVEAARESLIIYYSGHGLLGNDGGLFLTLNETRTDRDLLKYTALSIDDIRNAMRNSPATNKVLILDCCYSGRAIEAMTDTQSSITTALSIRGAVTLTAAPATKTAAAPSGERNTAFTGALLSVLRHGLEDGPELLTIDAIFDRLRSRLIADGYPLPQMQSVNAASHIALVRNSSWAPVPEVDLESVGGIGAAEPYRRETPRRPKRMWWRTFVPGEEGGEQPKVPRRIAKPAYVGLPTRPKPTSSWIQDAATLDRMRRTGGVAARVLYEVSRQVQPGISTDELDAQARNLAFDLGAYPSMLGLSGYPKSTCISVNEVICNGVPGDLRLQPGDIVSISFSAYLEGVHATVARTYPVGAVDEQSHSLISHAHVALARAISSIMPGRQLNTIGRVIESLARRGGYGVVRDYTGHGIGPDLFNGLTVHSYDVPDDQSILEPGLTFTIQPMLTCGGIDHVIAEDGWTSRTKDGSRCAEATHTVVVTETGAEILTPLVQ